MATEEDQNKKLSTFQHTHTHTFFMDAMDAVGQTGRLINGRYICDKIFEIRLIKDRMQNTKLIFLNNEAEY